MKKKYFFIIVFIFFNLLLTKALDKNYYTEEVSKEISSVFFVQKDSIINIKYNKIIKFYNDSNYGEALEKAFTLYDICKTKNDNESSYLVSFLIAKIYVKTNNHSQSLRFYKESLKYLNIDLLNENGQLIFSNHDFSRVLLRIGSSYQKLSMIDSAKFYYNKVVNLTYFDEDFLNIKAVSFTNLSGIYERDSIFDEAEKYALKAIEIHKKMNNKASQASAVNNLGNISLSKGEYKRAKEIYLEGINLIKHDNSPKAVKYKANLYYNLAWAMRNLKDYKAYDYQEMSYEIEDDIRDKELRTIAKELGIKYDFDTKKKLLEKEQEIKIIKEKDKIKIIGILAVFIFMLLLIIIWNKNLRGKNLELKLSQTQLIQKQKIDTLKSETQTRILNATIDGKELERQEIAEVLHDNVSALLSSANLHLQATRTHFNGETPLEVNKAQEIISEASKKIRDLSHNLTSPVLTKFGLDFAIKDITQKYNNSQLKIEVETGGLRRYHQKFETKIYNIIQELLNNILKHSKASEAKVSLVEKDDSLMLLISDNGVGFDVSKFNSSSGIGLSQIDARIEAMKGRFKIDSKKNRGTVIKSSIPILEKEKIIHV